MADFVSTLAAPLLKAGIVAVVVNEVRGVMLAGPVLYAMYEAGGTWMAMWMGFCTLSGIALSLVAPLMLARKLKLVRARA